MACRAGSAAGTRAKCGTMTEPSSGIDAALPPAAVGSVRRLGRERSVNPKLLASHGLHKM